MLNILPIIYFAYAVALFGGGMMGYVKAHSLPSVYGSTVFAILAIVGGIIIQRNPTNPGQGLLIGIETAMLVIGLFIFRYIETGKGMPAFPAIGMSVIVLILTLNTVIALKKAGVTPVATETSAEAAPAR